jgi:hypothetical protein
MKEVIDHVRTVHFALVIASTVLVASVLSSSSRALEQAVRDLRAVIELNREDGRRRLAKAYEEAAAAEFGTPSAVERRSFSTRGEAPSAGPPLPWRQALLPSISGPAIAPGATLGSGADYWEERTHYAPWIEVVGASQPQVFASAYPGWVYLERRTDQDTGYGTRRRDSESQWIVAGPWKTLDEFETYWNGMPSLVELPDSFQGDEPSQVRCSDQVSRSFRLAPAQRATHPIPYSIAWNDDLDRFDVLMSLPVGRRTFCDLAIVSVQHLDARLPLMRTLPR